MDAFNNKADLLKIRSECALFQAFALIIYAHNFGDITWLSFRIICLMRLRVVCVCKVFSVGEKMFLYVLLSAVEVFCDSSGEWIIFL